MPDREYPRALVLSANPFTRRHSNSLTLSSLFQGWPKDRLAQIYVPFATPLTPQFDVCETMWALTPLGLKRVPVNGTPVTVPKPKPMSLARKLIVRAAEQPALANLAYPLRELVYSQPALFRGEAMREVERFAPEVIYSSLGNVHLIKIALRLSDKLGAALVPFVTDDWPTTQYLTTYFSKTLRKEMLEGFDEILKRSTVRAVISQAMADEYAVRYGGQFIPFTQVVDADRFDASWIDHADRPRVRLVFAGQISLDRWKMLKKIGEALALLEGRGLAGELVVYTMPQQIELYGKELTREPVMRIGGNAPPEALPGIYRDADVLVHVESFDPALVQYTKFSLSTKMTEYMMAGRPILGFGPSVVGSMRYIREMGAGVVVDRDDPAAVAEGLADLLADVGKRKSMAQRARAVAMEHHEAVSQREKFRRALVEAVRDRTA